jgi:hypothetical protein
MQIPAKIIIKRSAGSDNKATDEANNNEGDSGEFCKRAAAAAALRDKTCMEKN